MRTDLAPDKRCAARGFTMIELMIALVLLSLMSAVLFGSLNLAGRSSEAGTAKAESTSGMRLGSEYLRTQLGAQHPQRMHKIQEFPLLFGGDGGGMRLIARPRSARAGRSARPEGSNCPAFLIGLSPSYGR